MRALGKHLLLDLHGSNPELLKKVEVVKDIMVSAAQVCKATVLDVAFHEFKPFGVSGVVVIAESHLSIHTWPEYQYAAVDIFTCGAAVRPEEAAEHIAARLECKNLSIFEMKRGVIMGRRGRLPHKMLERRPPADAPEEVSVLT
ncbi:MAG: adenosylmethionine decarboxylase [Candidatus Methylomirabilales bacterium]